MQNSYANDFNRVTRSYLTDLAGDRFDPIPEEIEHDLVKNAKNGDSKACKRLIEAHLRFVVNIAKRYKGMGVEVSDLIQEGNMGLFEALKRFDNDKGIRFCVYAKWWVEKYIKMALDNFNNINDNEILINDNDDERTDEENRVFIDGQSKEEDYQSGMEDSDEREKNDIAIITDLLATLDERTRFIIESCYGINNREVLSMVELGKMMNITPERVRQLKNRGMIMLRSKAVKQSLSLKKILF